MPLVIVRIGSIFFLRVASLRVERTKVDLLSE